MSGNISNTTYDFGFSFEDPVEVQAQPTTTQVTVDTGDLKDEIMKKLFDLESKLIGMDNGAQVEQYKALVESDVASKLKDVENLILPLLYNLMKNPEKEYIHWPNRVAIIDAQIEKITAITRYYERY
jgi:hypothetical protein